jgi:hypothetical protein
MKTIMFDKNAAHWNKNADHNLWFAKTQGLYLKDLFEARGYMYLNQICEHFGVEWNPDNYNLLYSANDGPIGFEFEPADENNVLIHIKH